jgi:uncharacterized protein DUF6265
MTNTLDGRNMRGNTISAAVPMTRTLLACAGVVVGLVALSAQGGPAPQDRRAPARGTLRDIVWLAGNWIGRAGETELEERWTLPAGGAMLAVSRTVKDKRMIAFEFLRIVERDGGLVYIAQPGGRPPTEFVLTEISGRSIAFENPSHDFPKRIQYSLVEDTLTATISGGGKKESYEFKRDERAASVKRIAGR